MADDLAKLIDRARRRKMSPQEIEAQKVSFAFGNAPDGDSGTIETMRAASTILSKATETKTTE